jgi:membrane protein involved in colicin uptake
MVYRIPKRVRQQGEDLPADSKRVKSDRDDLDIRREESIVESEPVQSYIIHKLETDEDSNLLKKSWNKLGRVAELAKQAEATPSQTSSEQRTTSLSEISIQEMVEAAQAATQKRAKEERERAEKAAKKAEQETKKAKKKFLEMKEKQKRNLKRESEKLKPEKANELKKEQDKASRKEKKVIKEAEMEVDQPAPKLIKSLSADDRQKVKSMVSTVVIKTMSRYQSQIEPDKFKEKAKIVCFYLFRLPKH